MKHIVNYRPQIRSGFALLAVAAVVTVFSISIQRNSALAQDLSKLNKFVQTKGNTASMQIFREGRDFIEAQNWQRAAEKFNDFIKGYPKEQRSRRRAVLVRLRIAEAGSKRRSRNSAADTDQKISKLELAAGSAGNARSAGSQS